jgi:hypothetical protein
LPCHGLDVDQYLYYFCIHFFLLTFWSINIVGEFDGLTIFYGLLNCYIPCVCHESWPQLARARN